LEVTAKAELEHRWLRHLVDGSDDVRCSKGSLRAHL